MEGRVRRPVVERDDARSGRAEAAGLGRFRLRHPCDAPDSDTSASRWAAEIGR